MTTVNDVVQSIIRAMSLSGFYSARPISARKLNRDLALLEVRNVLKLTVAEVAARGDLAHLVDHMLTLANGDLLDHCILAIRQDQIDQLWSPLGDLQRARLERAPEEPL